MIVDFTQKVNNVLTGKVFINEDKSELTLSNVACNALFANPEEEKIDGVEKLKRYELAIRIIKSPKNDLSIEEVAKIKELVAKIYGTIIVGVVYGMIEGKSK